MFILLVNFALALTVEMRVKPSDKTSSQPYPLLISHLLTSLQDSGSLSSSKPSISEG